MLEALLLVLVAAAVLTAAVYDAATLTIPNWISLVLIALFPVAALAAGLSWVEVGVHAGIGFASLLVGVALFAGGIIGGGDAKLFSAIALFIGASTFLPFLFMVAMAGGVLACVIVGLRALPATGLTIYAPWLERVVPQAKAGIPYGVAIAAGALAALPSTQIFAQLSVH